METFSALLALCTGNSPVTGEFPAQRPVTRSFDVFFDLRLNKRLSKQSWGWWFETPWLSLWRHCNVLVAYILFVVELVQVVAYMCQVCHKPFMLRLLWKCLSHYLPITTAKSERRGLNGPDMSLIHRDLVTHISHWTGSSLVQVKAFCMFSASLLPNQCWLIVSWNKLQWYLHENTKI